MLHLKHLNPVGYIQVKNKNKKKKTTTATTKQNKTNFKVLFIDNEVLKFTQNDIHESMPNNSERAILIMTMFLCCEMHKVGF